MPKYHTRNHRFLPSTSVNGRRAADHNRKLNVVDHNQFVVRSLKSVNTKTPHAKHSVNLTKKVWKATRNHNVKPQWKPTGRHFVLHDTCPLTRIMEPIVEPLELTPSVSSSSKVTMISRSKGRTVADSIAERLTRPTAYKFKTDCSIIPVWMRLLLHMWMPDMEGLPYCQLRPRYSDRAVDRVIALETDLQQTKKVYGVLLQDFKNGKGRLEKRISSNQSRRKLRHDFTTANVSVTTVGVEISTASPEVKTAGDSVDDIAAKSLVYIRRSAAMTIVRVKHKVPSRRRENYFCEDDQAKMLVDLINQRKRYFAAQKAEAKRNKPMTQAQQRTYMSNYIKHMGNYKLQQLKRLSFDEIKDLFETTMRRANTFVPMETEIRRGVPELVADSSQAAVTESTEAGGTKRAAEEELGQQSSKKQKLDELSQEELQQLMIIVLEEGMNIEALQTKYLIIDWEVYTKNSRMYWKIIQIGNHTESKRLFEHDADDELWKSQKHIHDITWRVYDTCGVHHVSTKDGMDIYMLVEREYPLSRGVLTQMLVAKLLVEQNNEMSRELLRKIFIQIERPRR
ncbi:hypothetical protein Tco_0281202 [Tanacetum coccineum]